MSELNDAPKLCGQVWGPVVHGSQHWCSLPVGHEGNHHCPCGSVKKVKS